MRDMYRGYEIEIDADGDGCYAVFLNDELCYTTESYDNACVWIDYEIRRMLRPQLQCVW